MKWLDAKISATLPTYAHHDDSYEPSKKMRSAAKQRKIDIYHLEAHKANVNECLLQWMALMMNIIRSTTPLDTLQRIATSNGHIKRQGWEFLAG